MPFVKLVDAASSGTHVANGGFAASVIWPQQYATLVYDKAESNHP